MKIKIRTAWTAPHSGPTVDPTHAHRGLAAGGAAAVGSESGDRRPPVSQSAFTLVETVVATLLAAIVLASFYAAVATGFGMVQTTREDLRATQVILQRMEAIRLSPYKLLQDPTAYPTNLTEYYSASGQTNGARGALYTVTYTWAPGPASLPPSYRTNVLLVTVQAAWKSGKNQHTRSMQTYVARYGIQRYVCGS